MTESNISGKGTGFLVVLLLYFFTSLAQVHYEALNHTLRDHNQFALRGYDSSYKYSVVRPPMLSDLTNEDRSFFRNYVPSSAYDSTIFMNRKYKPYSWFRRKLLYENFIIVDTGLLYMTLDPLFNISAGTDNTDVEGYIGSDPSGRTSVMNNTRGFLLRVSLGQKLSFESYLYENQSYFPQYVNEFVNTQGVVPGQGRPKKFKENGYDYAYSGGYFSYAPHKSFNFQFGHHKHFIGDGYRSMVLSDNSFNYPYLRLNSRFMKGKLAYSVMFASLQDLERVQIEGPSEEIFRRKGAAFHILEYSFIPQLKVSLMQATMFQTMDSSGRSDVDYSMFNPIMFVNPIVNGMNDVRNSLLAVGLNYRQGNKVEVYGQFVVDDDKFAELAYQAGAKVYLYKSLFLQAEGNAVSAGTYSSTSDKANTAFVHYNQGLAHVLGNNFQELIFRVAYRYKRFVPELQLNNYIQNVTKSTTIWSKFELAYLVNPATNMKLFASYTYRMEQSGSNYVSKAGIFYLGIKTDLRNIYWDF